ncbi:MAG: tetratricopeptide repeat protein, partial [Chitinivibrionales bacterium]|nr:tetratricopeptide repeat protein [Chitinivibrionales bacterium]
MPLPCIAVLFLALALPAHAAAPRCGDSAFVNGPGSEALRGKDYERALGEIAGAPRGADSIDLIYKQGCALQGLKKYPGALSCFAAVAAAGGALAPLAYMAIGEIQLALKRPQDALLALRTAQQPSLPPLMLDSLQKKIFSIARAAPESLGVFMGLNSDSARRKAAGVRAGQNRDSVFWSAAVARKDLRVIDSLLVHAACDSCLLKDQVENIGRAITADSALSAKGLLVLAGNLYHGRNFSRAESLLVHFVNRRGPAAGASLLSRAYYLLGMINFKQQEYARALDWLLADRKISKLPPEGLQTIARIYRRMNKDSIAYLWYEKIMREYPKAPA